MGSEDLVNELRAAGIHDSDGAFTIDMAAWAHKMATWRLADNDLWMLAPVMLAVACGATRLRVKGDLLLGKGWQMQFDFDGPPLPTAWLEALKRGSTPDDTPIGHFLALALELPLAVGVQAFRLQTWHPNVGVYCLHTSALRRGERGAHGNRIVGRGPKGSQGPQSSVFQRCALAPIHIELWNGEGTVHRPRGLDLRHAPAVRLSRLFDFTTEIRLPDGNRVCETPPNGTFSHVLWLDPSSRGESTVEVLIHGVTFRAAPDTLGIPSLCCLVAAPGLTPDLSMTHVMADAVWTTLTPHLYNQAVDFARQVCDQVPQTVTDAYVQLRFVEGAMKSPQIDRGARGDLLRGFLRLLGRCVQWQSLEPTIERAARLLVQGGKDVEDLRLFSAASPDDATRTEILQGAASLMALGTLQQTAVEVQALAVSLLPNSAVLQNRLAVIERIAAVGEGEARHRRALALSPDEGLGSEIMMHLAWCALARGDADETLTLCDAAPRPSHPAVRLSLLEARAEALAVKQRFIAAVEAVELAASEALAEGLHEDAVELAVLWRRLRILGGAPPRLGDGLVGLIESLVARLTHPPGATVPERLFALARTANHGRLHLAERLSVAGDHRAALETYHDMLETMRDSPAREPHLYGTLLRRIACTCRALGRPREEDVTRARWCLLQMVEHCDLTP